MPAGVGVSVTAGEKKRAEGPVCPAPGTNETRKLSGLSQRKEEGAVWGGRSNPAKPSQDAGSKIATTTRNTGPELISLIALPAIIALHTLLIPHIIVGGTAT